MIQRDDVKLTQFAFLMCILFINILLISFKSKYFAISKMSCPFSPLGITIAALPVIFFLPRKNHEKCQTLKDTS